jgi:hypothetical protein
MCCSGTRTIIGPLQSAHRNSTTTQAIPLTLSGRLLSLQRNYIGRGKFASPFFGWLKALQVSETGRRFFRR